MTPSHGSRVIRAPIIWTSTVTEAAAAAPHWACPVVHRVHSRDGHREAIEHTRWHTWWHAGHRERHVVHAERAVRAAGHVVWKRKVAVAGGVAAGGRDVGGIEHVRIDELELQSDH